jgi:hypothetical protein
MSKLYKAIRVNYPLFSSDFNKSLLYSTGFWKNYQKLKFIKIRPMGAELFDTDG